MNNAVIVCRAAGYALSREIRQVLRGRQFGLFVPTIGLIILIGLLGTLFGTILKGWLDGYGSYVPALATGLIAWTFIAATLGEASSRAASWGAVLRHAAVPLEMVAATALFRQTFILVQNLVLALLLRAVLPDPEPVRVLALAAGVLLTAAILFCLAHVSVILALRYRNFPQTLTGLLQAGFLLTPLIWPEYFLGRYRFLNEINPFYHLVSLVRFPLLGEPTPLQTWVVGFVLLLVMAGGAWLLHRIAHASVRYWL